MSKIKTWIDCGHGGNDPGAIGNGHKEKDITLRVGKLVKAKLDATGLFEVGMSRTTDITMNLETRTEKANKFGAQSFVSIHMNSFKDAEALGLETFAHNDKVKDLAECVHKSLLDARLYKENRGVKTANFHVLRETSMRACLIEMAFITNTLDLDLVLKNEEIFASRIAKGICDYHKVTYIESVKPIPKAKYIVSTGAFEDLNNAKNEVNKLKAKGIKSYIHDCSQFHK